jgi:type IV pilus assembly protein PilE
MMKTAQLQQGAAMQAAWRLHGVPGRRAAGGARALRGFTLVELIVAVAVVAILAAVAMPSYSAYVVRGKRAQAKTALLQAAQTMERVYSQSGCYSFTDANSCANGKAIPPGLVVTVPAPTATDYAVGFQVAPTAAPVPGQGYTLAATPCGGGGTCTNGSSFTDAVCGALTLDNTGAKGALGASSTLTTSTASGATLTAIQQCWDR